MRMLVHSYEWVKAVA